MNRGLIFLFLWVCCHYIAAQSPNMKFRHITSKDGLVQNNVVEILQDTRGFMWFGTRAGLNRFDGYSFRLYEYLPGDQGAMNSNQVSSMYEDHEGYIWIGYVGGGLDRFDPESETFEDFTRIPGAMYSIPTSNVASIIEDTEHNLWLATYGSGLFRLNSDRDQLLRIQHNPEDSSSLAFNSIRTLLQDSRGNLWIGFWSEQGVDCYNSETGIFEHFRHNPSDPNSLAGNKVYDLYEDSSGYIWITTLGNGVSRYNPQTGKIKNFRHNPSNPNSLASNVVRAVVEDDRGNIWLGTENGGLSIYNPVKETFTNITQDDVDPESLNNNSIYSLYKDKTGNIWIGTYTGGVNVYFKSYNTFEHFRKQNAGNSINHNSITSFAQDHFGNVWVGTDGGGANVLDLNKQTFRYFRADPDNPQTLGTDYVMGITEDSEHNIWVGTWGGGLSKFDHKTGSFTTYLHDPFDDKSLKSNNVSMAYEDSEGNIWVGTFSGGLNLFDQESETFSHFLSESDNPQSISSNHVINIIEGYNKWLWIGTDGGGINMLRPNGTFRRFLGIDDGAGLRDGTILSSLKDHNGDLWFGTNKGLHKLNANNLHFYYYSLGDSVSDLRVLGIEEDSRHNLWISTNEGLFVFDPSTRKYRKYYAAHGLQDVEFNRGASFKDRDGYLYFGGINGFNRFHPDSLRISVSAPPIEIVDFQIFNQSVEIGEKDSILKKSVTETDYLEIPWEYSMFSLDYAALSYNFSDDIEYAYMLENFDPAWNYVGNSRTATYTNLNPGKYIFKIKCRVDGEWGAEQKKLQIVILPPFWQTLWFRGIIVLLLFLLLVLVFRSRLRRIRKLNQLVDKRTREIRAQNKVLENQKEQLTLSNQMLKERQEKIETQAGELIQQRNELKQTNATKDKFLSIIAHDLRNPFNTIIGFSELLLADLKSFSREEIRGQLKQILRAGEQTHGLLEDLLLWANSQSGKIVSNPGNINVKEVCVQVKGLLDEQARRKNIQIRLSVPEELKVRGDHFMLHTVIRNLLSNAIKFTEPEGLINISATIKDSVAVITVEDNGVGIAKENLEKLWDITGQTSRPGTANEQGSGLGLLLCKEFVEKQKGEIYAESAVGEGSSFKFTIPVSH